MITSHTILIIVFFIFTFFFFAFKESIITSGQGLQMKMILLANCGIFTPMFIHVYCPILCAVISNTGDEVRIAIKSIERDSLLEKEEERGGRAFSSGDMSVLCLYVGCLYVCVCVFTCLCGAFI